MHVESVFRYCEIVRSEHILANALKHVSYNNGIKNDKLAAWYKELPKLRLQFHMIIDF